MPSYIGHYRMPVWAVLFFPLLPIAAGWMAYMVSQDALYADLMSDMGGPFAFLLDLPRPVLMAFFVLSALGFGVGYLLLCVMAIQKKVAFEIDAKGIRQHRPWGGQLFLAWDTIDEVQRIRSVWIFSGQGDRGRRVSVSVSLLGHDKQKVLAVISAHRPDLIPYLR